MNKTLAVLNAMQTDRVCGQYAIAGAVAGIYYTEPTLTYHLDVLVSSGVKVGELACHSLIGEYLYERGYDCAYEDGVVVEGWPVRFLPVTDLLDQDALRQAKAVDFDAVGGGTVPTRVLRAEHLAAVALRTGRPKDQARLIQLLDSGELDVGWLKIVLGRHGMENKWDQFCLRCDLNPTTGKG